MGVLSVGSEFSGIGLLDYGLHLAGLRHAWLCEADEWRRGILTRRFPGARVLDDVRRVGAGTVERVDVIAGGFPCKGASTAGKRTGFGHPETVLWREMARAVGELRPRYVLVENVANILALHDGAVWGEVLGDLAALGYDVVWDCLPAAAVGAPHLRDRVFAVAAYSDGADGRWNGDERIEQDGRADAARGARLALADAEGSGGQGPRPGRQGLGRAPADADASAADAVSDGLRLQPAGQSGGGDQAKPDGRSEATTDTDGARADVAAATGRPRPATSERAAAAQDAHGGAAQPAGIERRGEPQGTPVAVEWGEYGPAITRWEQVLGRPAREPLLQGVVARSARRVVRSRLSALGDGVQIQCGYIAGEYIADLERGRLANAS